MADTNDKTTKKTTTKTISRSKPVSKPSILSLDDGKDVRRADPDIKENKQLTDLCLKSPEDLIKMASDLGVDSTKFSNRNDLIISLMSVIAEKSGLLIGAGVLDVLHDGFGFLRNPGGGDKKEDIYVSQTQIRRFGLRKGDFIAGQVRPPKDNEKYYN